ncbi:MAG TPA: type III polyketide synthase [Pseudolabrys sp.]
MATAYLNRVATAVPRHDVHAPFERHILAALADDRRRSRVFQRMTERSGIEHRYSCISPDNLSIGGFYAPGAFPDTAARMRAFERHAPAIACAAVERLLGNSERRRITHLLTTCCTGFSAPGLDYDVIEHCDLPRDVERTMVGFMGCYAAINALKLARHIVRSEPEARVLMLNIELCTLHLQETGDLEQMLSFLIFADGCAAALVTADPEGLALDGFRTVVIPGTRDLITWSIRDAGFDMVLSGRVPNAIQIGLHERAGDIVGGTAAEAIDLWAVHPGGRTVLDAVERALDLDGEALAASREVLRNYGNMSSATVMFVLEHLLRDEVRGAKGAKGCAMSFGPGLSAEIMAFRSA